MNPLFQVHIEHIGRGTDRVPHRVTLQALRRNFTPNTTDLAIRRNLVSLMVNRTITAVQAVRAWNTVTAKRRVIGFLQGVNIENGASSIGRESIRVRDLTMRLFERLMADIHESNMDVQLEDIEWSFIISPSSFEIGGAPKDGVVIKPEYIVPKSCDPTWEHQEYEGTPLNCAAFAICYTRYKNLHRTPKQRLEAARKAAATLQDDMDWAKCISIAELGTYVNTHPYTRLTVICPQFYDHSNMTYTGASWSDADKHLFIVYDPTQQHFGTGGKPQQLMRAYANRKNIRYCTQCCIAYKEDLEHACDEQDEEVVEHARKRRATKCKLCNVFGVHKCHLRQCWTCQAVYKHDYSRPHRCIIYKNPERSESQKFVKQGEAADRRQYHLWSFDFESRMHRIPGSQTIEFVTDHATNSFSLDQNGEIEFITVEKSQHIVNMVVFKDVFSDDDPIVYTGDDALARFILFMSAHNGGRNICVAHNAAGYDTRLLFEEATKLVPDAVEILPITRGCKFMQLTIGRTIYRDSLLHLKGSLRNLAKDFLGDTVNLRKGHFPHLFNTDENRAYVGPIPHKRYFDGVSVMRSQQEFDEFNAWHDSHTGDWNFMQELESYCVNDVVVLAAIMKEYDTILMDKFDMSPWFNATSPSYVHEVFLRRLSGDLNLPEDIDKSSQEYQDIIQEHSKNFWTVLAPSEYWFARCALRGGRTEIRKIYHHVPNAEWERGVRIRYQDIVSMYPYVQAVEEYPVGPPTICIYDTDFYPCYMHRNVQEPRCACPLSSKLRKPDTRLTIKVIDRQPTVHDILSDSAFFGVVCATVTPPKDMFHPVLVVWDEESGKCTAGLNKITAGVFTSVEFKVAIEHGYTLDKLHRVDKYKAAPSLWAPTLKDLFIEKMANSEGVPSIENQDRLVDGYEKAFGMGEAVRESFPRWGKNNARKQTAKIQLNSGWGKHAERPIMPEVKIMDTQSCEDVYTLFQNISFNNYQLLDTMSLGESKTFYKYRVEGGEVDPNLHKAYLPAAIFVPAYGRLMLWTQLHKLGKRVLMHDTDSIIYLYDPDDYNIPCGDVWGEWDVEKIDSANGGIRTFFGLCPKSYGIKTANGKSMIKLKGLSLKHSTRDIINFEVLEDLLKEYLDTGIAPTPVKVPQMSFTYRIGHTMTTRYFLKDAAFKPECLKGVLDRDGVLFPFGFQNITS